MKTEDRKRCTIKIGYRSFPLICPLKEILAVNVAPTSFHLITIHS